MELKINFEKFNVGHYLAFISRDPAGIIRAVNELVEGGIAHYTIDQLPSVLQAFDEQYVPWVQAKFSKSNNNDSSFWNNQLGGIKGLN